jgi:hypothetical protein
MILVLEEWLTGCDIFTGTEKVIGFAVGRQVTLTKSGLGRTQMQDTKLEDKMGHAIWNFSQRRQQASPY